MTFTPRVREAAALHAAVELHAMIDISDGLLADLGHIAEESQVALHLFANRIPIQPRLAGDGTSPRVATGTDRWRRFRVGVPASMPPLPLSFAVRPRRT